MIARRAIKSNGTDSRRQFERGASLKVKVVTRDRRTRLGKRSVLTTRLIGNFQRD